MTRRRLLDVRLITVLACLCIGLAGFGAPALARPTAKTSPILKFDGLPPCARALAVAEPCQAELPQSEVAGLLQDGAGPVHARLHDDELDVAYTAATQNYTFGEAPYLCCDLQTFLVPSSPGVWAARLRSTELRHAGLRVSIANLDAAAAPKPLQVLSAEPDHALTDTVRSGAVTSAKLLLSPALGDARTIYVYRGERCRSSLSACSVIYMADGEQLDTMISAAGANWRADLAFCVLVGLADPPHDDQFGSKRAAELLRDQHRPNFARFERFLLEDVEPATEGRGGLPAQRWVAGTSNGGSWALNIALRHPTIFGGAIALSPGTWAAPAKMPSSKLRVFVGSGRLEGSFRQGALKAANRLRALELPVTEASVAGGHSVDTWAPLFWRAVHEVVRPGMAPIG